VPLRFPPATIRCHFFLGAFALAAMRRFVANILLAVAIHKFVAVN
jgi:hypothetical protein